MIVGHAFFVFGVLAATAVLVGEAPHRGRQIAVIGSLFTLLPDLDLVLAPLHVFYLLVPTTESVQFAATQHRALTHSLVILGAISLICSFAYRSDSRSTQLALGGGGLGGLLFVFSVVFELTPIQLMSILVFGGAALLTTSIVSSRSTISTRQFTVACSAGLLLHPFGDVFTGTPPDFFAPLTLSLFQSRAVFSTDPTINLVWIFLLELMTGWLAATAYAAIEPKARPSLASISFFGVFCGFGLLLFPPPTLETATWFVYSVVITGGVIGALQAGFEHPSLSLHARAYTGFITGLATITFAVCSYGVGYLWVWV